jgi:hypothetical protein
MCSLHLFDVLLYMPTSNQQHAHPCSRYNAVRREINSILFYSILAGADTCAGKETFCTAQQQAGFMHFGSSAQHHPQQHCTALDGERSYGHRPGDCPT